MLRCDLPRLTHLYLDKITTISQTTFGNAFPWMNILIFWFQVFVKFVSKGSIDNNSALVQVVAWRRTCDKPLPKPILPTSLMHICGTGMWWGKGQRLVDTLSFRFTLLALGQSDEAIQNDKGKYIAWINDITIKNNNTPPPPPPPPPPKKKKKKKAKARGYFVDSTVRYIQCCFFGSPEKELYHWDQWRHMTT